VGREHRPVVVYNRHNWSEINFLLISETAPFFCVHSVFHV
jgi:hypothetical protein